MINAGEAGANPCISSVGRDADPTVPVASQLVREEAVLTSRQQPESTACETAMQEFPHEGKGADTYDDNGPEPNSEFGND